MWSGERLVGLGAALDGPVAALLGAQAPAALGMDDRREPSVQEGPRPCAPRRLTRDQPSLQIAKLPADTTPPPRSAPSARARRGAPAEPAQPTRRCIPAPHLSQAPRNPGTSQKLSKLPVSLSSASAMRINVPPLTRGLLVCLFIFTLLNWILRPGYSDWVQGVGKPLVSAGDGAPYLAIIPSTAIVYPWVFLIATVVEENIFGLLITGLTIFYGGRYLERAWSSAEFAKFVLFVSMIPNILTYLLYVIGYAVSKNEEAMYVSAFSPPNTSSLLTFLQDGNDLRWHRDPSRLPRFFQATGPGAHRLHR